MPTDTLCHYCGRVVWGNMIYLGAGHYRHEECCPGSEEWADWYAKQPAAQHTSAGDILYHHVAVKPLIGEVRI